MTAAGQRFEKAEKAIWRFLAGAAFSGMLVSGFPEAKYSAAVILSLLFASELLYLLFFRMAKRILIFLLIPALLFLAAFLFQRTGAGESIALAGLIWALAFLFSLSRASMTAAGALLTLSWIILTVVPQIHIEIPFYAVFAVIVLLLVTLRGLKWLPWFLIFAFLVTALPRSEKPFDWTFLLNLGESIAQGTENFFDDVADWLAGMGFDVRSSATGYDGLGDLSSSRTENEEKTDIMLLGNIYRKYMYIEGAVFDRLSGDGQNLRWERSDSLYGYSNWLPKYLDLMYKAGITKAEAESFSRMKKERLTFVSLRTADFLHPENTFYLIGKDDPEPEDNRFQKPVQRGDAYRLIRLALDTANPYFRKLLDIAAEAPDEELTDYDVLREYGRDIYGTDVFNALTREVYNNSIEEMKDMASGSAARKLYLDQGGISEEMKELSDQVTADTTDTLSACRAIEAYLRTYTYNINASWSGNEPIVDEFLFRSKEGFCVHFASAMVLMLRAQGIPARYCEGYYAVSGQEDEVGTPVMNHDAHSWPEAWIDGYGWLRFEPTPASGTALDTAWGLSVKEETEDTDLEELSHESSSETASDETVSIEEEEKPLYSASELILYILILVGALVLIALIIMMIRALVVRNRLKRSGTAARIGVLLGDICLLIERLCGSLPENTTLLGYGEALALRFPAEGDRMKALVKKYYRLRFGKCEDSENAGNADENAVFKLRKELLEKYSEENGRLKSRIFAVSKFRYPARMIAAHEK